MTGRSFEGTSSENHSDASSFISKNNMMMIPEDDNIEEPHFGGVTSPQTEGDEGPILLATGRVENLSVIFSEN